MTICDICKTNPVTYKKYTTIEEDGNGKNLELCRSCYEELRLREELHLYQAYEETIKTITGELPRKFRWWHLFTRSLH